jgi:hypothetical protein
MTPAEAADIAVSAARYVELAAGYLREFTTKTRRHEVKGTG